MTDPALKERWCGVASCTSNIYGRYPSNIHGYATSNIDV